jgi:hypothetical protein
MSLPAALAGPAISAIASISPLDSFLQIFNTNPYFIGIMMLVLNLGGRFIGLEVTKKQEQFLQLPWVRRLLIFTVIFVATRSLWVAFWTTVTTVLLLGYLFNENSALCIFGDGGTNGSTCSKNADAPKDEMTPEEKEILHRLSSKAQRYQLPVADAKAASDDDILHTDIYAANLSLLKM